MYKFFRFVRYTNKRTNIDDGEAWFNRATFISKCNERELNWLNTPLSLSISMRYYKRVKNNTQRLCSNGVQI